MNVTLTPQQRLALAVTGAEAKRDVEAQLQAEVDLRLEAVAAMKADQMTAAAVAAFAKLDGDARKAVLGLLGLDFLADLPAEQVDKLAADLARPRFLALAPEAQGKVLAVLGLG